MKVAAYQMDVRDCYSGTAVEMLSDAVRECEREGVRLLCCPEGAIGGLADYVDVPSTMAIADAGALQLELAPLASETVTVVVGFTELDSRGRLFNAAAVFSRGEVVGVYRKRHPAIRRSKYTAGVDAPVFEVGDVRIGILICRDSIDRGLSGELIANGAQLLAIPTNNAMPARHDKYAVMQDALAVDSAIASTLNVPIVRADVSGEANGLVSLGATAITTAANDQRRPGSHRATCGGQLLVADVFLGGASASTN